MAPGDQQVKHRRQDDLNAAALEALSNPSRLSLVSAVVDAGEAGIRSGDAAARANLSISSTSGHLAKLADAGLVMGERVGQAVHYRANRNTAIRLVAFIERLFALGGVRPPSVPRDHGAAINWSDGELAPFPRRNGTSAPGFGLPTAFTFELGPLGPQPFNLISPPDWTWRHLLAQSVTMSEGSPAAEACLTLMRTGRH